METARIPSSLIYVADYDVNDLLYEHRYGLWIPLPNDGAFPRMYSPAVMRATITDIVGHQDGVRFLENELLLASKGSLFELSYEINEFGDLLLNGEDAKNYAINDIGELIYIYD